jgi:hypothetical protein
MEGVGDGGTDGGMDGGRRGTCKAVLEGHFDHDIVGYSIILPGFGAKIDSTEPTRRVRLSRGIQ